MGSACSGGEEPPAVTKLKESPRKTPQASPREDKAAAPVPGNTDGCSGTDTGDTDAHRDSAVSSDNGAAPFRRTAASVKYSAVMNSAAMPTLEEQEMGRRGSSSITSSTAGSSITNGRRRRRRPRDGIAEGSLTAAFSSNAYSSVVRRMQPVDLLKSGAAPTEDIVDSAVRSQIEPLGSGAVGRTLSKPKPRAVAKNPRILAAAGGPLKDDAPGMVTPEPDLDDGYASPPLVDDTTNHPTQSTRDRTRSLSEDPTGRTSPTTSATEFTEPKLEGLPEIGISVGPPSPLRHQEEADDGRGLRRTVPRTTAAVLSNSSSDADGSGADDADLLMESFCGASLAAEIAGGRDDLSRKKSRRRRKSTDSSVVPLDLPPEVRSTGRPSRVSMASIVEPPEAVPARRPSMPSKVIGAAEDGPRKFAVTAALTPRDGPMPDSLGTETAISPPLCPE